jgi:hypothetical protein
MTIPMGEWGKAGPSWPVFALTIAWQLWLAHAIAFFAHEYSHSCVAWMLGWKANPLALNYAHLSWTVVLIQLGIDQNVDEVPIFHSGHGVQAAIISAAGMVIGNLLITLPLSRWGYGIAKSRGKRVWAMLCYWISVASIGNLIDYVPLRLFTDGGDLTQDMFAVEQGLNWSPWTLLLVSGPLVLVILVVFLFRIMPRTIWWLFPASPGRRRVMAVLTALVLFGFYGMAGLLGGGPVSHFLSLLCIMVVMPVAAIWGGWVLGAGQNETVET